MAYRDDSGLSLDELRRRHEEYKKTMAQDDDTDKDVQTEPDNTLDEAARADESPVDVSPEEEAKPVTDSEPKSEPKEEDAPDSAGKDEEDYDDEYGDNAESELDESGNPFASIITTFNKIKDVISKKKSEREENVLDDSDDDYEDEEPAEEKKGGFRFLKKRGEEDEEEPDDIAEPIEDVYDDEPVQEKPVRRERREEVSDDYEDEDEDESESESETESGFKKFASLFVVREKPLTPEVSDAPTEEFDDSLLVSRNAERANEEDIAFMDNRDNVNKDMTELMSDGIGERVLSRKERRELREKQMGYREEEAVEEKSAIEPEEPTREYTPVTRPAFAPNKAEDDDAKSLKKTKREYVDEDDDYDEPKPKKKSKYDDDDDYDEPKSKKKSKYDDDDDDDDYDEPRFRKKSKYDDDDDDDDYDEPKFRKKSKYDDDDDYGDEYDYDEDDDYYEPSVGHYILGFFKIVIALILIIAIATFGLYFADQATDGGVAAYQWIREKVPFIDNVLPVDSDDDKPAEILPSATDAVEPTITPESGLTTITPEATDGANEPQTVG